MDTTCRHHSPHLRNCIVSTPRRIQLRQVKGWRLHDISPNATVVARPSRWGNPFAIGMVIDRVALTQFRMSHVAIVSVSDRADATMAYRQWLEGKPWLIGGDELAPAPPTSTEIRGALAGHDLACWCPLEDEHGHRVPCHADVLLDIANQGGAS